MKSQIIDSLVAATPVAPFVGAWIEIGVSATPNNGNPVAPFVGAWIEIDDRNIINQNRRSLRSSERGLKFTCATKAHEEWKSLRSSERGLKFVQHYLCNVHTPVAPFVGAWIEIHRQVQVLKRQPVAPFV